MKLTYRTILVKLILLWALCLTNLTIILNPHSRPHMKKDTQQLITVKEIKDFTIITAILVEINILLIQNPI